MFATLHFHFWAWRSFLYLLNYCKSGAFRRLLQQSEFREFLSSFWYDAHSKILLRLLRVVQTCRWTVELRFDLVVPRRRFPPFPLLFSVVFYDVNTLHQDQRLFIIFNVLCGHIFLFHLINSRDEFLLFLRSEFLSLSCVCQVNVSQVQRIFVTRWWTTSWPQPYFINSIR